MKKTLILALLCSFLLCVTACTPSTEDLYAEWEDSNRSDWEYYAREEGYEQGYRDGTEGYNIGDHMGTWDQGYAEGLADGLESVSEDRAEILQEGYDDGYEDGYVAAMDDAGIEDY